MFIILRLLSILSITGSIYWIYIEPANTEPKVAFVLTLFTLVSFYFPHHRSAEVFLTLHNESTIPKQSKYMLHIENKGELDAQDLQIIFPPTFQTYEGEIASIPKCLRAGELKKIQLIYGLGYPRQYALKWSWRGAYWCRQIRTSVIQVQ